MNIESGDVREGFELPAWRMDSVDPERMKTMAAILRDPNPIHFDVHVSEQLGLGRRVVNQGPINVSYVYNMLLAFTGSAAAIRRLRVRFAGKVFGGDALTAGGTVTSVTEADGVRTAVCDVWLRRDDGDVLVRGTAELVLR